ncbi:phage late control D family protein [Devosia naphthalenivorans]|uniref:phage late control D family protein n=1 Tax=Devosia naphthalenivorans TaxID=2082392 RepID=UPI000D38129C|nr:late control D family protein [Devosia naphthalenivorans]
MAWKVAWRVLVDGQDATDGMRPHLISVTVTDKDGTASDTCSLEFDDSGGQISLPRDGAKVQVYLDGVLVFSGTVDSVRSSGTRGGGRTLSVGAKGFDAKGKTKEPQSHHMDDATLQQFLDEAAAKAGLSGIQIDPAFANIKRDYWSADAESFLHIGQTLARELNATFKIRDDKAVLAQRGQGTSAVGGAMPTVVGIVGQNVISWSIAPITSRRKFAKTSVRYFDRASASFKSMVVETGIVGADAVNEVRSAAADEDQARAIGEGRKTEGEREGGEGSVELNLAVEAQAEGTFILSGARPGVDGTYRIVSVVKKADRGGGSTTLLELKQPGGGAGADDRPAEANITQTDEGFALPAHETLG